MGLDLNVFRIKLQVEGAQQTWIWAGCWLFEGLFPTLTLLKSLKILRWGSKSKVFSIYRFFLDSVFKRENGKNDRLSKNIARTWADLRGFRFFRMFISGLWISGKIHKVGCQPQNGSKIGGAGTSKNRLFEQNQKLLRDARYGSGGSKNMPGRSPGTISGRLQAP